MNKDLANKILLLFSVSFCVIPVLKIGVSFITNAPPIHLVPFVLMTFILMLFFKIYLNKSFWIISLVIGIYSLPTLFLTAPILDPLVLKYVIAAFVAITLIFIFKTFNEEQPCWRYFVKTTYTNLRYTSLLVFFILFATVALSLIRYPPTYSLNDFFSIFIFSRDNIPVRGDLITRTNLAYLLTRNGDLMSMQGPQMLIFPLIFTTIYFLFKKHITVKKIDYLLFALLIVAIFLVNSRAIALYVFLLFGATLTWRYFRSYEKLFSFFILPFPLLLAFLGHKILNGREIQINYTLSKLSLLGHGIGSGLRDLQVAVASYAFDNIHLEAIHYFGILGYGALLLAFIYFIIVKKANRCFYVTSVVFAFLSLNFNFFDPYFLIPILLCLTEPLTTDSNLAVM